VKFSRRSFGAAAFSAAVMPVYSRATLASPPAAANQVDLDPLRMVDPELRKGAAMILSRPLPYPLSHEAIKELRLSAPPPPNVLPEPAPSIVMRRVPGRSGDPDVGIAIVGARESGPLRPAILHIHGGGFIVGRVQDTFPASQRLAQEFDCVVVEVDYRLSPETRFPGPLEDCHSALVWLHANAEMMGIDKTRIAVMGESAGGGLAAMLAIAARDRATVPLCCQILIYPMLDDRTGSIRRVPPFIGTIGWNEAANVVGWSSLLGQTAGLAHVPAGAVPARVEDLSGLPPTFIGVGAIDLFVEEDITYARRLIQAGVATQMLVVPGAYHGFDFISPESRAARTFTTSWKQALGATFTAGTRGKVSDHL